MPYQLDLSDPFCQNDTQLTVVTEQGTRVLQGVADKPKGTPLR